jgi:hypothetical protein
VDTVGVYEMGDKEEDTMTVLETLWGVVDETERRV